MDDNPKKPYKAIVAGIVTAASGVGVALADGVVSGQEWGTIAVATVLSVAAVFGIKNPTT